MIHNVEMALFFCLLGAPQDSALEGKAREIEGKLMAPCCWTQVVSQHYSGAADEIRRDVRRMLAAGMTEPQILDAYVEKYGERILASPRAVGFNATVYILPWVSLALGLAVVVLVLKKLRAAGSEGDYAERVSTPIDAKYAPRLEQELKDWE